MKGDRHWHTDRSHNKVKVRVKTRKASRFDKPTVASIGNRGKPKKPKKSSIELMQAIRRRLQQLLDRRGK